MSKTKNVFPIFVFIVCLINFLIRIPFFSRILTNDANLYTVGVLRVFQNHLNPFVEFWGYKPPFLFELTALLFKIFGPSIIVGNALSAIASSITLWYTYLLGTHLFNKKAGVWAMLILFFFPIFSAQSLQFTDAIFVTPLLLATIYYYYRSQRIGYLISATLAVLTRETSICIPIFLGIYEVFKTIYMASSRKKIKLYTAFFYWLPLAPFVLWMGINKYVFGWFLWPINIEFFTVDATFIQRITFTLRVAFLQNGLYIPFAFIMLYVILVFTKKIHATYIQIHATILFLSLFAVFIIFYSIGFFHPRYILFLYPYLCILASGAIFTIWKPSINTYIAGGTCMILIAFQIFRYAYLPMQSWGEADLSILHTQTLYTQSLQRIEQEFPNPLIVTSQVIYPWKHPYFGYAKQDKKSDMWTWNVNISEEKSYAGVLRYASIKGLSPIIFIQQSDDMNSPAIFNDKRILFDKVYDGSINTTNYHLLYIIR